MSRRKARKAALQALFQLEFNEMAQAESLPAVLGMEEEDAADAALSGGAKRYAEELVEGTRRCLAEIDALLTSVSRDWKVERMSSVDRNIARMAVYEMRFGEEEIAPNIIINEAVELAKLFGGDVSGKFVNGVLGSLVGK